MKKIIALFTFLILDLHGLIQSNIVYFDDQQYGWVDNHLTYVSDEEGNHIPDFSHSGYRSGNSRIPTIPTVEVLKPENSDLLQEKIKNLKGGALLLLPGKPYLLDKPLILDRDGIVLRGIRDEKYPTDPRKSTVIHFKGNAALLAGRREEREYSPAYWYPVGSRFIPVGSRSFEIHRSHPFLPGDRVEIRQGSFAYYRTIKNIDNKRVITLNAPLFHHLDQKAKIGKDNRPLPVKEIGIEDLTILAHGSSHAVELSYLQDSWVSGVFVEGGFYTSDTAGLTITNCTAYSERENLNGFHCGPRSCDLLFCRCHAEAGERGFWVVGEGTSSGLVFLDCTASCIQKPSGGGLASGLLFDNVHFSLPNAEDRSIALHFGRRTIHSVAWKVKAPVKDFNLKAHIITQSILVEKPPIGQNYTIGCNSVSTLSSGYRETFANPSFEPISLYEAQVSERKKGEILDSPYLFSAEKKQRQYRIEWQPVLSPQDLVYDIEGSADGALFVLLDSVKAKYAALSIPPNTILRIRARDEKSGVKSPYSNPLSTK